MRNPASVAGCFGKAQVLNRPTTLMKVLPPRVAVGMVEYSHTKPNTKDIMTAAIVIPARYASSRFPGKPLCPVAGMSMLERVWRIARSVPQATRIVIATEDERILAHARAFDAEAIMTSPDCANGTERVYDAVKRAAISEDIVLNLQGDALLTPPWVLGAMIDEMIIDTASEIVTPAVRLEGAALDEFLRQKKTTPESGTTVVFDLKKNALYFSKAVIPHTRQAGHSAVNRHIGLYGFRKAALARYVALTPSPLEQTEGLEQLRALEYGMVIRVTAVDYRGRTHWSIDAPEDVQVAERIIEREGELLDFNFLGEAI
jgi:3-deoxy-manno-octulosonate cytidylyltransferase (CMP-KDO synthetase)